MTTFDNTLDNDNTFDNTFDVDTPFDTDKTSGDTRHAHVPVSVVSRLWGYRVAQPQDTQVPVYIVSRLSGYRGLQVVQGLQGYKCCGVDLDKSLLRYSFDTFCMPSIPSITPSITIILR